MKPTIFELYKQKGKILEGIKNFVFTNEHVEEVAQMRMDICNKCVFKDDVGKSCFIPETQPCCSECGCSLKFKLRSMSSECPKNFWKAEMSEDEEEELNNNIK